MTRLVCLWFPLWPIQRFRCDRPDVRQRPLALHEATLRGERLVVCSPQAVRQGLRPGMSRSEAETLSRKSVLLLPAEPQHDHEELLRLAQQCQERFSPLTAIEDAPRPDSLYLDIRGCEHLFGGERELLQAMLQFFRERQWKIRAALTETIGASWALAHYGSRVATLVPSGRTEAALRYLPPAALRLPLDALQMLDELGIQRIDQLLALPRAELASRFDPLVPQRLRQALGIEPELFTPVRRREPPAARWASEDPLRDLTLIEQVVGQLLEELLADCRAAGKGLLQCVCTFQRPDRNTETYIVELIRPTDDSRHLLKLLALQWERRPCPAEVNAIRLEASRTGNPSANTGTLFDPGRSTTDRAAFVRLMERLSSRLGKESVLRVALHPDAQPEFALSMEPWLEADPSHPKMASRSTSPVREVRPPRWWERPLMLCPHRHAKVWSVVPNGPPQRVEWKHQMRSICRWWGPERIETGWWRAPHVRRDYYRVELETGEWLWLFREQPSGGWRLHGAFD